MNDNRTHTVFSHIIQKRLSQVNENVATDALAFVLESSESSRNGMMKLLRGVVSDIPALRFKTQQTEGSMRPDMWGYCDAEPRLFVESKFWAGLTDNQPVSYLEQLSVYTQPTILLVIAPAARQHTLWRELNYRLADSEVSFSDGESTAGISFSAITERGPVLALTSWTNVLSVLEHEAVDDPRARGDLVQLRALCNAADIDAFQPISRSEITDQRTPDLVLQLNAIVQETADACVKENTLSVNNLRPQAAWERIGRYARLSGNPDAGIGVWFGIHFELWKAHGTTPLWLVFYDKPFGRASEVRRLLEPWTEENGRLALALDNGHFAIPLEIPAGEEKPTVVRSLADQFKKLMEVLAALLEGGSLSVEKSAEPDENVG